MPNPHIFGDFGPAWVDVAAAFGGEEALAVSDFQAPADAAQAAELIEETLPNGSVFAVAELSAAGIAAIDRNGRTQFRVYFARENDTDSVSDVVGFHSGDDPVPSRRPQLAIEYQLP